MKYVANLGLMQQLTALVALTTSCKTYAWNQPENLHKLFDSLTVTL